VQVGQNTSKLTVLSDEQMNDILNLYVWGFGLIVSQRNKFVSLKSLVDTGTTA